MDVTRYKLVLLYSYNGDKINWINNKNDNPKSCIIVFVIYLKLVSWKRILKLIYRCYLILETEGNFYTTSCYTKQDVPNFNWNAIIST